MPVLDGSFEAFVTNLGKYNEGELVGEWVHFPTTEEEMKKVLRADRIGFEGRVRQVYENGLSRIMSAPFMESAISLANTKTSIRLTTSPPDWMRCPTLSLSISWRSWIAAAMK